MTRQYLPAAGTVRHPAAGSGARAPATVAPLVGRLTHVRRLIYETLLADTHRRWTVHGLTSAIPEVNECIVRDNLNLLLAEGIVHQVPHQRALTVALTERGEQTLTAALARAGTRAATRKSE